MVEPRPEANSVAAIRRIVNDALTPHSPSSEPPADGPHPRAPIDWPDAELDMASRSSMTPAEAFVAKADRQYHLTDFTCFHDREFIVAAYGGLLERNPDPAGFAHYIQMLRQGIAKTEILGRLRYSAEGKRVDATVATLRLRYPLAVASRQPVIGNILGLLELIGRANAMKASIRRLEAHMSELARQQTTQLALVEASAHHNAAVLEARVEALRDR